MSSYKLNVEGNGDCLAIMKSDNKKMSKKFQPMICIGEGSLNKMEDVKLNASEHFELIPNINKERDVLYVIGQSGSGKSYFVSQYGKNYKSFYPKNSIYVFSTLNEDKDGIDRIGKINRIKLDDEFVDGEVIDTKEFEKSLIIFDDIDNISSKKIKDCVFKYLNNFLQTGRHYKISLCITYHIGCSGHATRMILNECTSITYFGATIGGKNLKYLLDSYLGLDKKAIEKIKKLESRAITIMKTYPKVVVSEKEMYILRND